MEKRSADKSKKRQRGEGAVYWDKSRARWVGQVRLDGRWRKVSDKDKDVAARKLGKLIHGVEAERNADRRTTVKMLLSEWQATALPGKGLAPSTIEAHAWAAALWVNAFGATKLVDLEVRAVERALTKMATTGRLSKGSLIKVRSTLRQAVQWGERRRMVSFNAAAVAELPTAAKDGRDRRALTADELKTLMAALAEHPLRPLFLLMARVGLRPGEASGICADVLDLDGNPPTVAVIRAIQLRNGRPRLVDDLKTAGARRTLAIPADVVAALRPAVTKKHDVLLFSAADGRPLWPSTVRAELAAACVRAEVPVVTPNELRHTAATLLADSGLAPHQVADILGHRSTRMVDAVYRHRPAVILGADTSTDGTS